MKFIGPGKSVSVTSSVHNIIIKVSIANGNQRKGKLSKPFDEGKNMELLYFVPIIQKESS